MCLFDFFLFFFLKEPRSQSADEFVLANVIHSQEETQNKDDCVKHDQCTQSEAVGPLWGDEDFEAASLRNDFEDLLI